MSNSQRVCRFACANGAPFLCRPSEFFLLCFFCRMGAARHTRAGLFSAGRPIRRPLGAPPRRKRGPAGLRPVEYGLGRPPALEGISTVLCKQNRLKSPRATSSRGLLLGLRRKMQRETPRATSASARAKTGVPGSWSASREIATQRVARVAATPGGASNL